MSESEPRRLPEDVAVVDAETLPGGAKAALEAVLMVVDEPVSEVSLAAAVNLPVATVRELLAGLQRDYDGYTGSGHDEVAEPPGAAEKPLFPRGFELRNVAGGWRI